MLTGALAASASAAVSELTIDPTAQLSPGRLRATLTGTVTCDPGTTAFLDGQIMQPKNASGFEYAQVTCDGTAQAPLALEMIQTSATRWRLRVTGALRGRATPRDTAVVSR